MMIMVVTVAVDGCGGGCGLFDDWKILFIYYCLFQKYLL